MLVLVAPDSFGGTLTADEAAAAIADGWRQGAPRDELALRPQSDGGPGFVDVLRATLGGDVHATTVTGPLGSPVVARWLAHDDPGHGPTAYVESAQACGLALVPEAERRAGDATTRGVGELLLAVHAAGLRRVVVGLGGSATTDGGAGLLAALGLGPVDDAGTPLRDGGAPLAHVAGIAGRPRATGRRHAADPEHAAASDDTAALPGLRIVLATDVDNPLVGPHGAAAVFGPQKGATADEVRLLDAALDRWAGVLADVAGRDVRHDPGAGAAGGLGAALIALGGTRASGAALVRAATGVDADLARAGLVVTGEGSFDWQSLRGKVASGVAAAAQSRGVPCVVVAGRTAVGRREAAAIGVDAAYSVAEHAGSERASLADPAGTLTALARSVAEQWGSR